MKKRMVSVIISVVFVLTMFLGIAKAQTVLGENLALGKQAFSQTRFHDNAQWNLASLTDGKKLIATDYQANAGFHSTGEDNPTIIGIDLGESKNFNTITLYPRIDDQTGGQLISYAEDFTIEVSNDNTNWACVQTVTGNTNIQRVPQNFTFDAQSARYVRISVTKTTGGGTTLALAEFEVYNAVNSVETISASIPSGTYTTAQSVELKTNTSGANIYYTLDGSEPTQSNTQYTLPIEINQSQTIKAIGIKDGFNNGDIAEFVYEITADNPFLEYTKTSFYDDFSNQTESNSKWSVNPTITNGEYVLNRGIHAVISNEVFQEAVYEAEVKTENNADWVGILFNKTKPTDTWGDSGYMLYIRGEAASENKIEFMKAGGQSLGSVKNIPNFKSGEYIKLKILSENGNFKIYINNTKVIDVADSSYTSGYTSFFVSGGAGNGKLDNVSVKVKPVVYEDKIDEYLISLNNHKILRDDVKARFPQAPKGHSLVINSSSNEAVVGINQSVTPPDEETQVTLNVTVACENPANSKTQDITYTIPKKSTKADIAYTQNLEYGLFYHYIWGGADSSTINELGQQATNISDFVNDFDMDKFISDTIEFNPQYVVFTVWHYKMNPLYYSEVYRKWRDDASNNNPSEADKDIIMEMADRLNAAGIDLILYTHPNDLHDFSDADKAKFDYKYRGDTSFNKELWNDYLAEQYAEVTTRYKGKIKGYFIDEGLGSPANDAFVDYERLRAVVKDIDSSMVLIQNWSEVAGKGSYKCDIGMVEDRIQTSTGKGDWGDSLKTSIKDGNSWPSFGVSFAARVGERPFNWSAQYDKDGTFTGTDEPPYNTKQITLAKAEDVFRYTVYQAASNYDGLGSCWAFGPYSGSSNISLWEPGVKELFTDVAKLINPIKESLYNTKPSEAWQAKVDVSTSNPRVKTGSMGEVTYVAMSSSDGKREFIHVLNPNLAGGAVKGKTLTLPEPKNKKDFIAAKLVKDGSMLEFKKNTDGSIEITLGDLQSFDENDTVIELVGNTETQVAPIKATPTGATYYSAKNVELKTATADAEIYYTTDGAIPTKSSKKYTSKITVDKNTTIKAKGFKEGLSESEVATFEYIIQDPFAKFTEVVFEDDFSDDTVSNTKWSKNIPVTNGEFIIPLTSATPYNMKNVNADKALYEFEVAVNNADWVGLLFNREDPSHIWENSGYLVYMRNNGDIDVYSPKAGGTLATGKVPNFTAKEKVPIKILCVDGNIQVYAKNEKIIDCTNTQYLSGYAGFWCSGNTGNGKIDNVKVKVLPPTPNTDEEIQSEFNKIKTQLDNTKIFVDQKLFKLPKTQKYYSVSIKQSDKADLINTNGAIIPPYQPLSANLTFEISYKCADKIKTENYIKKYDVPKGTQPEDVSFFMDAKYGLFVHYVWAGKRYVTQGGQPQQISARTPDGTTILNVDDVVNNFDAVQFAQDCKEMGVQYVILTAWHFNMNPLYPSEVFKKWRTEKDDNPSVDLIDKVYKELNKNGVDLYLYTHPYDIHDFYEEDRATFDYKYRGDLTFDYDKWNDYLNETYAELCTRYKGKIKGMFLDEGLANPANNLSVDYDRLRSTIKTIDPTLIMIQNEYNGKYSCDTSMWELPTAWHGGQYNKLDTWQVSNLSIGTSVGNIYQGYSWWAIKNRNAGTQGLETVENMFKYTVMQMGSNTEGGGIAWAAGPYAGKDSVGMWEDGVKENLVGLYEKIKPIEESIKNTRPSTSFVTENKSKITDLTWGVATESADGSKTYIHIIKPPQMSKTINIGVAKDKKTFSNAKLMVSQKNVELSKMKQV